MSGLLSLVLLVTTAEAELEGYLEVGDEFGNGPVAAFGQLQKLVLALWGTFG